MLTQEEITHRLRRLKLDYRALWLEAAHSNGQIAETLADALGWQATPDQPLPDALALAGEAARRITALEKYLAAAQHRRQRRPSAHLVPAR